jgi:cell division protein FtsB
MPDVIAGSDGERLRRWMEEGRNVFEGVRRLLHEYDRLKVAADASRQEGERLQQHCEELRQEVKRLRTEAEFVKKQRTESAQWFAAKMNEGASRFFLPRPGENA